MGSSLIQLVILGGVALFLILRLRSVLGTRTGFEKPAETSKPKIAKTRDTRGFEVIDGGGIDHDIADYIDANSDSGHALAAMKQIEPTFRVGEFAVGARQAYEMILMAFENGDLSAMDKFLSPEVHASFTDVIETRRAKGWKVDASFVGVRELKLTKADFDPKSREADITMRFVGELTSVVHDATGAVIEGDAKAIRRQKDVWTFSRIMGSNNPNWVLAETGA
jgi:predicted lipid-binding transport protein (Tim44 family)